MTEIPNPPSAQCACWDPQDQEDIGCVCGVSERVLRAVKRGDITLDPQQREWCLTEIDKVEGYNRNQYLTEDDPTLAHGVLCAWVDYCRDKGLL